MFKIKKNEKNKNDSLRTLETENSSQLRKFIFFTYSPLSQEFLPKKKCIIKSKNNETKKIQLIYLKFLDIGINLNIINLLKLYIIIIVLGKE